MDRTSWGLIRAGLHLEGVKFPRGKSQQLLTRGFLPVSVKNMCFSSAFALHHSSINCSPAPDLAFLKSAFPRGFFSGGVSFSETPVSCEFSLRETGTARGGRGGQGLLEEGCGLLEALRVAPQHIASVPRARRDDPRDRAP